MLHPYGWGFGALSMESLWQRLFLLAARTQDRSRMRAAVSGVSEKL